MAQYAVETSNRIRLRTHYYPAVKVKQKISEQQSIQPKLSSRH